MKADTLIETTLHRKTGLMKRVPEWVVLRRSKPNKIYYTDMKHIKAALGGAQLLAKVQKQKQSIETY